MSLQGPNVTANSLLFALRLTEIGRWGLVSMSRTQSVGEHSYRVAMIATAMYDFMEDGVPHNRTERIEIGKFAQLHDITEVLTGDLDAIFKLTAKVLFGDVLDQITWRMGDEREDTKQLAAELKSIQRAAKGSIVEAVVKLADQIEAIIYLMDYGTNQAHKQLVRDNILERMWTMLEIFRKTPDLTKYNWARVEQFINMVLQTPGLQEKALRDSAAQNESRSTGAPQHQ